MAITAIRYDSPEALGTALGDVMGAEEVECQAFTTDTKRGGAGAWMDDAGSIHFWVADQQSSATLVALFAMELASTSSRVLVLPEASRNYAINLAASIALRAHQLAMQFQGKEGDTVVLRGANERLH